MIYEPAKWLDLLISMPSIAIIFITILIIVFAVGVFKNKNTTTFVMIIVSIAVFSDLLYVAGSYGNVHKNAREMVIQNHITEIKDDDSIDCQHEWVERHVTKPTNENDGTISYDCEKCGRCAVIDVPMKDDNDPLHDNVVDANEETMLVLMCEDIGERLSNYPATVKFDTMSWTFEQDDLKYTICSTFECQNAYGVKEEHILVVIAEADEDGSAINPVEICVDGEMVNFN